MILLKYGETLTGRDDDLTAGRLETAGKDFKEGGLSGAVCTDEPVTVALREIDVHILEQRLIAYTVGYVVCTYHFLFLLFLLIYYAV